MYVFFLLSSFFFFFLFFFFFKLSSGSSDVLLRNISTNAGNIAYDDSVTDEQDLMIERGQSFDRENEIVCFMSDNITKTNNIKVIGVGAAGGVVCEYKIMEGGKRGRKEEERG